MKHQITRALAFGGGARSHLAWRVARAVRQALPEVGIQVAGGFAAPPAAPRRTDVKWAGPQPSLVPMLASASAAVLAGGITLYEAAALGVPSVAIPVVPAQAEIDLEIAAVLFLEGPQHEAEALAVRAMHVLKEVVDRNVERAGFEPKFLLDLVGYGDLILAGMPLEDMRP